MIQHIYAEIWPRPRRHRRDRDPLPPALGDPRGRQGDGPERRRHRRARLDRLGQHGPRARGRARQRCRARPHRPASQADDEARRAVDRHAAPSVAACRRLHPDRAAADRDGADRQWRDGRPHLHRMGQGRHRRARHPQDRRARARHADLHPQMLRLDRAASWRAVRAGDRPAGSAGGLRHAVPRAIRSACSRSKAGRR